MSGDQPAEDRAATEAADWFARLKSRVVSTEALESFAEWRRSPENLAAYYRLDKLWRDTEALEADPAIQSAIQAAIDRPAKQAGAAARRRRRALLGWGLGGLAIVAAVAIVGGPLLMTRLQGTVYETPVGVQSTFRLSDGTIVRLDTGSRIAVRMGSKSRDVRLQRGQAFFNVVHDPSRPFLVTAGPSYVTDIGTAFDVRLDGQRARITLVEGLVKVEDASTPSHSTWTLRPGQQLSVGATKPPALKPVDAATATSWTSGRLVFQGTPLAEAVREVGRYSDTPLRLDDDQLAQTPVNGVFDTGDVAAFVAAATTLLPLRADHRPDGGIDLVAKPAA